METSRATEPLVGSTSTEGNLGQNGSLVYFDAGFFQKLTRWFDEPNIGDWQRETVAWFNQTMRPFSCLCTPLNFLELVGLTNIVHPILTPLTIPKKDRPRGEEFGKVIAEDMAQKYSEAYEFYSQQADLQPGEIIARANIKQNHHMNRSPHVRVFTDETIWRFIKRENFEEDVWSFLALDRVQAMFGDLPNRPETTLRHIQFLKEFLSKEGVEYNPPLFRSFGLIWKTLEPRVFYKGTLFRMKLKEDLGDSEFLYYAVAGLFDGKQKRVVPVTVLTCEAPDSVRRRLTVVNYLLHLFRNELIPPKLGVQFPELTPGRVVCFDEDKPVVVEDIDVASISNTIDDLSLSEDIVPRKLASLVVESTSKGGPEKQVVEGA